MKVEQIATLVNTLSNEILGEGAPQTADDFSNVVDVGKAAFDATSTDNYLRKLVDHIGKMVFVNRPYSGRAPSVVMSGWEFGAVLQKIDIGIPDAEENPTWKLQNGQTYNQDQFKTTDDVVVQFWSDKVTFQVHFSFADEQVKSAFNSIEQLNAFFSMIYTQIDTSMTIKVDSLTMGTINNFIANVYNAGKGVNLLALYKAKYPDRDITVATALSDMDFLKFAALNIMMYSKYLTNASKVFNLGNRVRHTPRDYQRIIMLDLFASAANVYLQSDTFHNEFVKLPSADTVSFWQYSGDSYAFEDISSIDIIPSTKAGVGEETKISGVLACIFDKDALGINNYNRRVTSHYNANGEFINNWFKMDAQYFNDLNENFVFFYIAD